MQQWKEARPPTAKSHNERMFKARSKCCRHRQNGFAYHLQNTASKKAKLGKIIVILKPRRIGATALVAAEYDRTHWQVWSWDISQCDWEMWNECGKMDPKEKLSPINIAIWLTDTTTLKHFPEENTMQNKTAKPANTTGKLLLPSELHWHSADIA